MRKDTRWSLNQITTRQHPQHKPLLELQAVGLPALPAQGHPGQPLLQTRAVFSMLFLARLAAVGQVVVGMLEDNLTLKQVRGRGEVDQAARTSRGHGVIKSTSIMYKIARFD